LLWAAGLQVKLAICHALAQSTKLCVYEERVVELVLETKHLPQALALNGTVQVQVGGCPSQGVILRRTISV
jgi:uncharacterized Rmd1/YagE family protein